MVFLQKSGMLMSLSNCKYNSLHSVGYAVLMWLLFEGTCSRAWSKTYGMKCIIIKIIDPDTEEEESCTPIS